MLRSKNPEGENLTVAKAESPPQTPPVWPRWLKKAQGFDMGKEIKRMGKIYNLPVLFLYRKDRIHVILVITTWKGECYGNV